MSTPLVPLCFFMLAERLLESRKRAGLSQHRFAIELGERYDQSMISHIESGRSGLVRDGLVRAAQVLDVSVDYLLGLTDDPAPVDDRVREAEERAAHEAEERAEATVARIRREEARNREQLEAALQSRDQELARLRAQAIAEPETPDPDVSPIQSAPGWHDEDYESVRRYESEDVALAAGTGTFADQEPVPSEVKFLKSWLRDHRLRAKDLFLADVLGDSMETTIYDGDSALVDESRTSPRSGRIYALRTGDGLLVKRLRKRDHRWWADSDNEQYEPEPLDDRARIMGRVVWWAHTD